MVIENNNNVNPKNYVGIDLDKRTLEVKRILNEIKNLMLLTPKTTNRWFF